MTAWRLFLESIDTTGAHVLICLGLGLTGVIVAALGHADAARPLLEFLPIAAYAMRPASKPGGGQ